MHYNVEIADESVIGEAARTQLPRVTDPDHADALLSAVIEALTVDFPGTSVRAEFRAGAVWERKGHDVGGDLSAQIDPSPYRPADGSGEDVVLEVTVRIGSYASDNAKLSAFVDTMKAHAGRAALLEAEASARAKREELARLEARTAELRRALGE